MHNTQPWRWRIHPDEIELHADWTRHLTVTDPDRRDLLLSCGAALHHLQVALAARGIGADVARLPDPGCMARVEVAAHAPDPIDAALPPPSRPGERSDAGRAIAPSRPTTFASSPSTPHEPAPCCFP